jgi:hypothetical protein
MKKNYELQITLERNGLGITLITISAFVWGKGKSGRPLA